MGWSLLQNIKIFQDSPRDTTILPHPTVNPRSSFLRSLVVVKGEGRDGALDDFLSCHHLSRDLFYTFIYPLLNGRERDDVHIKTVIRKRGRSLDLDQTRVNGQNRRLMGLVRSLPTSAIKETRLLDC